MVRDPLLECSFLIPICRDVDLSDGAEHDAGAWQWLKSELFALFEGATRDPGLLEGFYKDPDTERQVTDKSYRYTVAVAEDRIADLRQLLSMACWVFQQKCVYLSVAGHVEFVEPPIHDSG
jgi:hypothetical protein